ncbi:MAG: hypothetical protein WB586_11125 [Chthoniobacterales bacterium]
MEQTDPHRRPASARQAFADHMNRLVASDRAPTTPNERKSKSVAEINLERRMITYPLSDGSGTRRDVARITAATPETLPLGATRSPSVDPGD